MFSGPNISKVGASNLRAARVGELADAFLHVGLTHTTTSAVGNPWLLAMTCRSASNPKLLAGGADADQSSWTLTLCGNNIAELGGEACRPKPSFKMSVGLSAFAGVTLSFVTENNTRDTQRLSTGDFARDHSRRCVFEGS